MSFACIDLFTEPFC